jgi:hypothetical protein
MNFIPHGTGIRTIEEYQRFWAAVGWVIETHVTDAGAREALCAELRKQREILEREMGVEPLAEIETAAPVDVQVDSQHEVKAELLLAVQQRWRATRTKLRQLLVAGQSLEHAAEVMEPEELRQLIEKLRQTGSIFKRVMRAGILIGGTGLLSYFFGHWSLLLPLGMAMAGASFHFWWCWRNNIHPLTAEPYDRYLQLRGWK